MNKKSQSKKRQTFNVRYWMLLTLLFVGIFAVFVFPHIYDRYQRTSRLHYNQKVMAATQPNHPKPEAPLITGKPARIAIPAVGIDLPVIDGFYYPQNQSWTLSLDKAQFATITSQPNNKAGNTFIYAHNRKGVFLKLPKVVVGDQAIITTENGHTFTYIFKGSYETNPRDTQVFSYAGDPILTLQTCSGVWYQNRQMFQFELLKAE